MNSRTSFLTLGAAFGEDQLAKSGSWGEPFDCDLDMATRSLGTSAFDALAQEPLLRAPRLHSAWGRFGRRAIVVAGLGVLMSAVLVTAALARGKPGDPKPIPGGFSLPAFAPVPSDPFIYVLPPLLPFEMSTIGDFDGTIGAADIQGRPTGATGRRTPSMPTCASCGARTSTRWATSSTGRSPSIN
jgi:hypothetical protein